MKLRQLALAATMAAAGLTSAVVTTAATAAEQFFPALVYRTGAYAPNGAPFANGYIDYLKLTNVRGGINGVKVSYEECETGYATDRGIVKSQLLRFRRSLLGVASKTSGTAAALPV